MLCVPFDFVVVLKLTFSNVKKFGKGKASFFSMKLILIYFFTVDYISVLVGKQKYFYFRKL